jgi:RNA polymerase sigma-70 factor
MRSSPDEAAAAPGHRPNEPRLPLDAALVHRLYQRARADRWPASEQAFAQLLHLAAERAFPDDLTNTPRLERALGALQLEDLALACACAEGVNQAWDHFVREHRPVLYRAADAIDPSGGAREIADSLYGELFGLGIRDGERQSLFRYYHGRSSLATWLRAVLSQRYVDRLRQTRRLDALPDEEGPDAPRSAPPPDPSSHLHVEILRRVLAAAVAAQPARDRLRLRSYYSHEMTLAQIGKVLGEHEATASRHLARTRKAIRQHVETALRDAEGWSEAEITECFASVVEDPGPLDLADLLGSDSSRKKADLDRSK